MSPEPQFDFGENWKSYSGKALSVERVTEARTAFQDLMDAVPLQGRSFLDIGFGQGLGVCLAREAGAEVCACDINPKCGEALATTSRWFPGVHSPSISVVIGSILETATLETLRAHPHSHGGTFDIVHSWGVLHHTGNMTTALTNAASLVRPGGHFIVAIYNSHWSSPVWWFIKRLYVTAPRLLQRLMNAAFVPVILLAKLAVTRRNPLRQERGMDFSHDVVDWIGGYPYEYATADQLARRMAAQVFTLQRVIPATVPTGCNQFVFRKSEAGCGSSKNVLSPAEDRCAYSTVTAGV